jgi:hypothetical protein
MAQLRIARGALARTRIWPGLDSIHATHQQPAQIRQLLSLPTPNPVVICARAREGERGRGRRPKTLAAHVAGGCEMAVDEVTSVYVGGLPYEASEDMLRDAFEYYGTIVAVKVRRPLPFGSFPCSLEVLGMATGSIQ